MVLLTTWRNNSSCKIDIVITNDSWVKKYQIWLFKFIKIKEEPSLKVFFSILGMSAHKNQSRFEFWPIRKPSFDIWIDFYMQTWREKDTFKFGSYFNIAKKINVKMEISRVFHNCKDSGQIFWKLVCLK